LQMTAERSSITGWLVGRAASQWLHHPNWKLALTLHRRSIRAARSKMKCTREERVAGLNLTCGWWRYRSRIKENPARE
jgi:hypothetical protein